MEISPTLPMDVEAEITYLTTEEGGRRKPGFNGYRPQFRYDGHDWDAIHTYPDVELVMPGQTATAYLSFISPECHVGRLFPGKKFEICEGARVVGRGRITKIIELEASAKRTGRDSLDCP
jgi:translation elongation factor EF-Tu-like GTPase